MKTRVAIIGSGNIGTDLMIKIARTSSSIEVAAMVGVDPESDGLRRARRMGIATTHEGIAGLQRMPEFADIALVFDATSARAHPVNYAVLREARKTVIDLTPAALGPFVVPSVNLGAHAGAPNLNMVTCGGQATVPMVAAVSRVAPVAYAEIVSSIASRSAGPGTRANIDEFTQTTARALEVVGGAGRGKAIIVLNPAEPPRIMRNTVFVLVSDCDEAQIERSIAAMVGEVRAYVPGYRLKQAVQMERYSAASPVAIPGYGRFSGIKCSIFLEVEGAAHYLPAYAGNLDVMTSAALATAERISTVAIHGQVRHA